MPPGHTNKARRLADECDDPGFEYVSKSRLTTFEKCPRSWAIKYVAGHRAEETFPMRKGTQLHGTFEAFYEALSGAERGTALIDLLPSSSAEWLWGPFGSEHVFHFLSFEALRLEGAPDFETYQDVKVESELWWDDPSVEDSPPWFGFLDAMYPAASFPWVEHNEGWVVCDFKTGKTPKPQYRETGIFLELEFYRILAEQNGYNVVAMAGYYPQADDVLVCEPSAERENMVFDLVESMLGFRGVDPNDVEKNEQPLCRWKTGMCDYYRHGKVTAEAWDGECDSEWGTPNGPGPNY